MFKVFRTETFEDEFHKLPKTEQQEIKKFEKHLSENPFVGKPLGMPFFREKKFKGRRVYYLIYEDVIVVLMVALSDKKTQQATIDAIKENIAVYSEQITKTLKKT